MARKRTSASSGDLFIEKSGQLRLVEKSLEQRMLEERKVECLGLTFDSEDARRNHFTQKLREKLADPVFRSTSGFPRGSDEDILRLSNPPYYTACPNPFITALITAHNAGHDPDISTASLPYTSDVLSSKTDIVYTAHSYHTKVPPEAISTYVRHYTKPGDVVLDFFSGSGMTAIACRMVDQTQVSRSLSDKALFRLPICIDLSPAATFITSVYLWPDDEERFERSASKLLRNTDSSTAAQYRCGLEISDTDTVEYILWIEALFCPTCQAEVVSDSVVKATTSIGSADEFPCPHCGALISKAPTKASGAVRLERRLRTTVDIGTGATRQTMRRVPVGAQVIKGTSAKAANRRLVVIAPDAREEQMCEHLRPSHWFPTDPLIRGERFIQKDCLESYGITNVHHFYLPRQLAVYAQMWASASKVASWRERQSLLFFVQSNGLGLTVLNRYQPTQFGKESGGSQVNRYFTGTLYVPSMVAEVTPGYAYTNKLKRLTKAFALIRNQHNSTAVVSTQSATDLSNIPNESVDYIFVDPPFGRNLQYSELNQIWESWLRVKTDRDPEAIMDSTRRREALEYAALMRLAFHEGYRVLRAGKWMTIEFHNSSNIVWHAIQEALFASGFIVAHVRALNKGQETYKQSRQGLMSQDLVISAYKPTVKQESVRSLQSVSEQEVWQFVREHLRRVAQPTLSNEVLEPVAERQPRVLFDRMVAFFVQRQISVPLSAMEFYARLANHFPTRDEMIFLEEQATQYDKERYKATEVRQFEMFVEDEASAIEWVRKILAKKPQKSSDLQPVFMRETSGWAKHETPIELEALLRSNFIQYDGKGQVPSQIHSYLSTNYREYRSLEKGSQELRAAALGRWYVPDPGRQIDLEKLREKELLSEFETYKTSKERKLKTFRTEAVRAGFKAAYDAPDYTTIVSIAAKLPENVLEEDEKLLMYYDVASMRLGDG
jgi:DNA methylase